MMRNFALACLVAVSVHAQAASAEQANQQAFLQWAATNGKSYANSNDMNMRMEIWTQN